MTFLRIGPTANEIGASRKSLQLWLQRGQVPLFTASKTRAWWRFSVADRAALVIVRRLCDSRIPLHFGGPLGIATIGAIWRQPIEDASPIEIADVAIGHFLFVWRNGNGEYQHDVRGSDWRPPATAWVRVDLASALRCWAAMPKGS